MVDYAEGSFACHESVMRTARKPHKCFECRRTIEPGEQYEDVHGLISGEGWECYKTCRHCLAVREWLRIVCGGWLYGGVFEDLDEHRQEFPYEPYNPRWMNIAVSGMRKQWRKKDGTLWRPMTLPAKLPTGD